MATSLTASTTVPSATRETPVFVPGYGWVQWSRALLDAQARYLLLLHRPDQSWSKFRRVGVRRQVDGARCLYCGREWTCPEAVWANAWLSPMSRVWGRPARSRGGRHRAPGYARVGGGSSSRRLSARRGAKEAAMTAHPSAAR
jgi:hypothetical protein